MKLYRKSRYVEQSEDSFTYTAGIDVFRKYGYHDEQYHLSAIEFHHKDKDEAIKLRDLIFDFLERQQ